MIPNERRTTAQAGMGLVELMVAMVIGLFTTLVIMQVFSVFEGDKRTTTSGADAQTNGMIALYNIKRQVAMAGFGLPTFSTKNPPLQCSDPNLASGGVNLFPVAIADGGNAAGASDTVSIRIGSSLNGGVPFFAAENAVATNILVKNSMACQVNDVAIVSTGTNCTFTKVTAVPDATHVTFQSNVTAAKDSTSIACLGNWTEFSYLVNNGQMRLRTTVNGVNAEAQNVEGIVNIQVQYGVSNAANSNDIAQWVDATGAWEAPNISTRNRIKAIRVAVVARSGLLERDNVTAVCSSLSSANPTGLCAWEGTAASPAPEIDLSDDANWQRYRYRVYETIVPLRNVIWTRGTMTP
ncbi:MAG: PilW family protein [Dechloromonas sp.]|uniref:PilW family protein n=1 Tax=Dechloromonas sp. TaxID=1917218 RepID=UPI0027F9BEE1|nr:PilW family protein [Dechloromonas sp.]MBT9523222.1 PilW family protein [Dechloromonas sp.]